MTVFRRSVCALLLLLAPAMTAQPRESLETLLRRTSELIERKELRAAEAIARDAVQRFPRSADARATLAWLTLWNGRYAEARTRFRELTNANGRDAGARLGLAQAEYWSGDLREAQRGFTEVLRLDASNVDARRALAEIRAASRPGFATRVEAIDDDQPYRAATVGVTVYGFADPLTKWRVSASAATFASRAVHVNTDASTASIGGGIETTQRGVTLRGDATALRFPDETTRVLPRAEVLRPFGSTTLSVVAERRELLRAASALRTHATATSVGARWARERVGETQFAVRGEALRYFDDNRGVAADAYVLFPLGRIALGASSAWRDTEESRFSGSTYDPYYTPQKLAEARIVAATSWQLARATVGLHVDGGVARDELFGIRRTFHPWTAAVTASVPIGRGLTFSIRGQHESTIYYSANELTTSVAGRF